VGEGSGRKGGEKEERRARKGYKKKEGRDAIGKEGMLKENY